MIKNSILVIILLLQIGSSQVFSFEIKVCELTHSERVLFDRVVNKVEHGEYDEELYALIPDDYQLFNKFFVYLDPLLPAPEMVSQKFIDNANVLFIGVDDECSRNLREIDFDKIEKLANLFSRMKKIDEKSFTEKVIRIYAGPWTADNFLDYDELLEDKVLNADNLETKNILSTIELKILKGLIVRYNTTNPRYIECERKYGLHTICPIQIPDYVLKMPKNIQERFKQAREELLK